MTQRCSFRCERNWPRFMPSVRALRRGGRGFPVKLIPNRAITGSGSPCRVARKTGTNSVGATLGLKAKFSRARTCRRRGISDHSWIERKRLHIAFRLHETARRPRHVWSGDHRVAAGRAGLIFPSRKMNRGNAASLRPTPQSEFITLRASEIALMHVLSFFPSSSRARSRSAITFCSLSSPAAVAGVAFVAASA